MTGTRVVALALGLLLAASSLEAQGSGDAGAGALRAGRRALPRRDVPGAPAQQRQQLEQQIRRSLWRAAKRRIGFTDEQMVQLEQTSQRYDVRRRSIAQQEKTQRVSLRREILADSSADQAAINSSLEKLHDLQRQRLDLQLEEQKEFAGFMTPLQRAKFQALQEQVRRRVQELVRARPDSIAGAPSLDPP